MRYILLLTFFFSAMLVSNEALSDTVNSLSSSAASQQHDVADTKTYKVKKGDTLLEISRKFAVSVNELKRLNNLKSDKLKIAQIILLEETIPAMKAEALFPYADLSEKNPKDIEKINEIINAPEPQHSKIKDFLVSVAQQTLGIPYRFGSNTYMATDCSGYVQIVFRLLGINLPRSVREQFHLGEDIDKKDLSLGDLVFFRTYAAFPSHVGIYLGNNLFIHASTLGKRVTIDSLAMPYFVKRFIGAKRLPALYEVSADNIEKLPGINIL